jgi:hypothetical protein
LIGSIFAAGATWTKNEGFFLGLIILLSAIACQILNKKFKFKLIIYYSLFIILQLPWLIFKLIHHLSFANADGGGLFFKPAVFKILFSALTTTISWNVWWLIFLLVLIFNWRKIFSRELMFLSLTVFGSIIFYFGLYVFTSNYKYIIDGTILQRNLLTIVPMAVFYIALFFREQDAL